jgi:hypothetical protein
VRERFFQSEKVFSHVLLLGQKGERKKEREREREREREKVC